MLIVFRPEREPLIDDRLQKFNFCEFYTLLVFILES